VIYKLPISSKYVKNLVNGLTFEEINWKPKQAAMFSPTHTPMTHPPTHSPPSTSSAWHNYMSLDLQVYRQLLQLTDAITPAQPGSELWCAFVDGRKLLAGRGGLLPVDLPARSDVITGNKKRYSMYFH